MNTNMFYTGFYSLNFLDIYFLSFFPSSLFRFPLWTDVLNFLYHHFLLLSQMWLEKYLSTILVVITRAKRIVVTMPSLSFPSPSYFFKTEKLRFLFVRTNAWTELKADGNLGFLTQSDSLTSEHDVSTLLYVWLYVVVGRTRRENAFKSRTSLKSCRRPTEKRTFTEMQCPIKRDWISVAAAAIFLRVGWRQRRSSNDEWGAEGSRNWGLSVSRFLSLFLFLIWKKNHDMHAYVFLHARTSNEIF
jgi:hypothetical protein